MSEVVVGTFVHYRALYSPAHLPYIIFGCKCILVTQNIWFL